MGESRAELRLGPNWLYPAKALVTHARSAAWWYGPSRRTARPGLRILFYHRVADADDELAVTPRAFAAQMDELARRGFRGVSIDELVAHMGAGEPSQDAIVGLSFDDGYEDVAEHAVPELERHAFRASVFVATGVTDGRVGLTWYARQPALLSWESIRDLDRSSTLQFEAHTVTHSNLVELDDEAVRREIEESRDELEKHIERRVDGFCYPAGVYGERERRLVSAAGYRWAVSCEPGINDASTDLFGLRRIQIDARDNLLDFRAKLLGGHDRPFPLRAAYRRARYRMPAEMSSRS